MDYKQELIKRAIDANGLTSLSAAGTVINPNMWDLKIREFLQANLVVTPLCEQFDFTGIGVDHTVTVDGTPSAAAAIVETDATAVVAYATRKVTFTPSEYGAAYQVTQKELNRGFFNIMERMTKKLGYALALKKDTVAVALARTAASGTNAIIANSKAALTAITSTDTLNYADIIKSAQTIENQYYVPKYLIINHYQKAQLLNLSTVNDVSKFGTRDAIAKGLVGELFGLQVFVSTQITAVTTTGSYAKAIVLGTTQTGEQAMGYANKQNPMMKTFYDVLGRFHTLAAHEEYDFQALHPGAIVTLSTFSA